MFKKMLKSDLKQKKGLSIVLFLFITVASVLVFVGGVQIYEFFTGNERNVSARNSSDILIYNKDYNSDIDVARHKVKTVLDGNSHVVGYYCKEVLNLDADCIDFDHFDESDSKELFFGDHYLTTIPKDGDLLYTMDDKPFVPESGTVWLSEKMRSFTGCAEGDILKISTDMGNECQLTIAGFYKQPFYGSNRWYVVSESDYEVLSKEIVNHVDLYGVKLDYMDIGTYLDIGKPLNETTVVEMYMLSPESSDEYILGYIIAIFVALVSLFLILIVVMTIRFTMIAAMKEEEREIGTLRAIGADSLRFRWLFSAKYIFFAIVGGAIGIISGIPLSKMVMTMFMPDSIMPSVGEMLIIGICSVVFITALIIGFSLLVMRHINKISVVDAIRGENHAERTGRGRGMLLHKRKIMAPSFFLACSDILKRFKRYVFLFIAYTLGVLIILFVVNIKYSVINPDYLRYALIYRLDFALDFSPEQMTHYIDRMDNDYSLWDAVNDDIKKAGIAAHVDADHYQTTGTIKVYENDVTAVVWTGSGDISGLSYHSGNVPVQKDEIAVSWSAANNLGLMIGDEVDLTISYNTSDSIEPQKASGKFRITGFVNFMDGGTPTVLVGSAYQLPVHNNSVMGFFIDAEGSEKDKVFSQLEDLFGADTVLTGMEYTKRALADYSSLFDLLESAIGGAVLFILMLMTYLYTSVFIAEETSEIALMKSIGFSERTIKASHIFRILILSLVSVVLGQLLLWSVGQMIVGAVMNGLGITGFRFVFEFPMNFIVIPMVVIAAVVITQWINLKKIGNIDICRIKDE